MRKELFAKKEFVSPVTSGLSLQIVVEETPYSEACCDVVVMLLEMTEC